MIVSINENGFCGLCSLCRPPEKKKTAWNQEIIAFLDLKTADDVAILQEVPYHFGLYELLHSEFADLNKLQIYGPYRIRRSYALHSKRMEQPV